MADNQLSREERVNRVIDHMFQQQQPGQQPPSAIGNQSYAADIGTSIGTGFRQLPGVVTGLADIAASPFANRPFTRAADAIGEFTGFQPSKGVEANYQELTPETRSALQNVEQAQGFGGTLSAYLRNPRAIGTSVAEAIPGTLAGGGLGGALGKAAATRVAAGGASALTRAVARPAVAAGLGEGAVAAGFQMEGTDPNVDPLRAAGGALAAGAGTALIAGLGGAAATRLGFGDPEMVWQAGARKLAPGVKPKGLATRIFGGAISEGVFQEMPQGAFEQITQNWAEEKPLLEGVDKAAVQSMVAGMGMGAVAGPFGPRPERATPERPAPVQPRRQRLQQLDIENVPDKELVNGVNTLNDLLETATPEQAEALRDGLARGQAEISRRNLSPTVVDEARTLSRYTKLRAAAEAKQAKLKETRAQNLTLADRHEQEIATARAELDKLESIYPQLREEYEAAEYAEAKQIVTDITGVAKGKPKRLKKVDQERLAAAEAKIAELEAADPTITERVPAIPVGETEAESPAPKQETTATPVGQYDFENPTYLAAVEELGAQPGALFRKNGTKAKNNQGEAYVDMLDEVPAAELPQLEARLTEKVEKLKATREAKGTKNAKPALVEEQLAYVKARLKTEAPALEEAAAPEAVQERATQPLSYEEQIDLLQFAQGRFDAKDRMTPNEMKAAELWSQATLTEGRKDPMLAMATEWYLQNRTIPDRKNLKKWLRQAREKTVNALAVRRQISEAEAAALLPEDYLRLPTGTIEKTSVREALKELQALERTRELTGMRGAQAEAELRKAAIAAGIIDPQFGRNPQDDTANTTNIELQGMVQDSNSAMRQVDSPNASPSKETKAQRYDTAKLLKNSLRAGQNLTKEDARKLAQLDRTRTIVARELTTAEDLIVGLQRQEEFATQLREIEPRMKLMGKFWDSLLVSKGYDDEFVSSFTWDVASQDDAVLAEFNASFFDNLDPENWRADGYNALPAEAQKQLDATHARIIQLYQKKGPFDAQMAYAIEAQAELQDTAAATEQALRDLFTQVQNTSDTDLRTYVLEAMGKVNNLPIRRMEGKLGSVLDKETLEGMRRMARSQKLYEDDQKRQRQEASQRAQPLREALQPKGVEAKLGSLTYGEQIKAQEPVKKITLPDAKKAKRYDQMLAVMRRDGVYNTWIKRRGGVDSGYSTVGEDGITYTAVKENGVWNLYIPTAPDGFVAVKPEDREAQLFGAFESFDGEGDSIQKFVAGQTQYTMQSLYRQQARQRAVHAKRPVRSDFIVQRRKRTADNQAAVIRQRLSENPEELRPPSGPVARVENTQYAENLARMRAGIEVAEASNQKALKYYRKQVKSEDVSNTDRAMLAELEGKAARLAEARSYWFSENPSLDGPNSVPRSSVAWEPITTPSTVANVKAAMAAYVPPGRRGAIKIVQSWAEIEDYLAKNNIEVFDRAGGLIHNGNIFMIADNIQQGREAGTLMHEVGVHMSMTPRQINLFASAIRDMAKQGNEFAQSAMASVDAAVDTMAFYNGSASEFDENHEIVAYFVEEAVVGGVDPTKLGEEQGVLKRFFDNLLTYIRTTMRALGLSTKGLSAQDVVDAAYGAADSVFRRPLSDATVRLSGGQAQSRASSSAAQAAWVDAQPVLRGAWKDAKFRTKKLGAKFMFGYDFAQWVSSKLSSAPEYFELVARRIQTRGQFDQRVQHAVNEAKNLTVAQRTELNEYLIASQKAEAWGFAPDWNGAANPTKIDPALEETFNSLLPEQQQIIINVFKLASELQTEMRNVMRAEIEQTALNNIDRESDPAKRAEAEDQMLDDLAAFDNTMGPQRAAWLPLRRHGEIAVVYQSNRLLEARGNEPLSVIRELKKDPEHYYVEFFDSITAANPTMERLQAQYGEQGKVDTFAREEQLTRPELIPFNLLNALRAHTENSEGFDQYGNPVTATANAQMKAWNKYYIQQLSETSIRKSELTREDVAGFDRDMLRAFIEYGTSVGGTIAGIQMNRETQGVLQKMRNEAKMLSGDARLDATGALNEVMERHGINIDPNTSPWQNKIMGVTSFWMLLTSPAYYLQNSTQPWMLTLPVLAGRFGFGQSAKALADNYPVIRRAWAKEHDWTLKSFSGELANLDVIAQEKGDQYKELIDDLVSRGLFDIGIAADLGNFTSGGIVQRTHAKFTHAVRSVEVFNRGVTALAAMDLALKADPKSLPKKSTGETMTPHEFAVHQVMLTQGDYSGHNAPSIISKLPAGKLITQFRKFQLIQIGLLTRMVHGSFKGATPEERAMAKRQLGYVLGAHGVAGGLLGLPMSNVAGMVIASIFGDDDEPADFELMMRREIGDDAMADLILKGLPAFANVDVSSKIGMGQTFSILPFTDIKWSRDGIAIAMAGLLGGPTGAQAMMWADGIGLMEDGNYAMGLAQALPRGFRDAAKAITYSTEGVRRRNPAQDMAISADEFSWLDLGMQGIGLPTSTITDRQNKSRWLLKTREHLSMRSARIKADYIKARRDNDAQGQMDARRAWRDLQTARVKQGFKRQPYSLLTKAPQEQRKREGRAIDGVFVSNTERRFMDLLD